MKYFVKNLVTGKITDSFGSKEALESYLSGFSVYTYDLDHKKYRYTGNTFLDEIVGKSIYDYRRNLKKVKRLIDAGKYIFRLPDSIAKVDDRGWSLSFALGKQSEEETAIETLMADTLLKVGSYISYKVYIKGRIVIVNERGIVYDYTDFISRSKVVDKGYFADYYRNINRKELDSHEGHRARVISYAKYRCDPIPFTRKYKHRSYGRLGVSRHERWLDVEDVKEYTEDCDIDAEVKGIRANRRRVYVDHSYKVANHSSWKEKKCRKQWMRGDKGSRVFDKHIYDIEELVYEE
mgnify:CR=1 FL=1